MKITYLVRKYPEDVGSPLVAVSHSEWLEIVRQNPDRYFIRDDIIDGTLDRVYIEVSRELYTECHRERCRKYYNEKEAPPYTVLSLDAEILDGTVMSLHEVVATTEQSVEDAVQSQIDFSRLRGELAAWKPWAVDMLTMYIDGQAKTCSPVIARKYGVSERMVRKYKRQFEEKVILIISAYV